MAFRGKTESSTFELDRDDVHFVLVRPNYLGNIGSTARVMKNFGFKNLRLVSPPKNYKDAEARKMSVGAFDVLKSSQTFESLSEALKDIQLAFGTTCGKQREVNLVNLDELGERITGLVRGTKLAVVFGDERDGLLKDELARCHFIITVPTEPDFPSLNLSQAAGFIAYELSCLTRNEAATMTRPAVPNSFEGSLDKDSGCDAKVSFPQESLSPPSGAQDDAFFADLDELLHKVRFTRQYNRDVILTELRSLYQRAQPTSRELSLLKSALRRLSSSIQADGESAE